MKKIVIELTKYEIRQLLSAASQMECDFLLYQQETTGYRKTAERRNKAFENALDELRKALKP